MIKISAAVAEGALGYYPHSAEEALWVFRRRLGLICESIMVHIVLPLVLRSSPVGLTFTRDVCRLLLVCSAYLVVGRAQIADLDLGLDGHIRRLSLLSFFAFG